MIHEELTDKIISSFFTVYNTLGIGFLEKVYENAMKIELEMRGLKVVCQKKFQVIYKEQIVGFYYSDLIVEDKVIIEIKITEYIENIHKAQLLNYLKISNLRLGLLINFSKPRLRYQRLIN